MGFYLNKSCNITKVMKVLLALFTFFAVIYACSAEVEEDCKNKPNHFFSLYKKSCIVCEDPPKSPCGKSICDKLKSFCKSDNIAVGGYARYNCPIACGVKACLKTKEESNV